ncbi:MAG: hypothetical protein ACYSYL_21815 [Planctomycetota bacterium]|jgi:antirestriction protein ArdC
MDFRKMNLIELGEFWLKDWEKDSPKLEDPTVEAAKRAASELELLELLHMFKEEDYIETIWNIKKHLTLRFTEMLEEKVRQIEKSVQVLLKEHDLEQANITIGQLNRLKGGI